MAGYAPVAPPEFLRQLKHICTPKGMGELLGDYHLLLAHDVAANPDIYHEIFDDLDVVLGRKVTIIMDNSLIELGHPVDTDTMLTACNIVRSDYVVLPDYMQDREKTVEASTKAYDEWSDAGLDSFMAVIHGVDYEEGSQCIKDFQQNLGPKVTAYSVPKIWGECHYGRMVMLLRTLRASQLPIHLLGFTNNIMKDIACCLTSPTRVMGIDSAVPIRASLERFPIYRLDEFTAPRGDFWEKCSAQSHVNEIAAYNIRTFRRWIDG